MGNRDLNSIEHILSYCREIRRTLSEIDEERDKYDESSTQSSQSLSA